MRLTYARVPALVKDNYSHAAAASLSTRLLSSSAPALSLSATGRPTSSFNSTTRGHRTLATTTSVASQLRNSFAHRHKTSYRLRSTLAQGFLSTTSKEHKGEEKPHSSTSPLLEAQQRRTACSTVSALRRQPKTFNKLTHKRRGTGSTSRP